MKRVLCETLLKSLIRLKKYICILNSRIGYLNEYTGQFYNSCSVIWKLLFKSTFVHTELWLSVEILVKTDMHLRCGNALTKSQQEIDKSLST